MMPSRRSTSALRCRRHRHVLGEGVRCCGRALQPGQQVGAAMHHVELVGHQDRRTCLRQQRHHLLRRRCRSGRPRPPTAPGLTSASELRTARLEVAVQRTASAGSEIPACRRIRTAPRPRVRTPTMRWRAVCALREVMLIFCPTSALSRVDLPTLGPPIDRRSAAARGTRRASAARDRHPRTATGRPADRWPSAHRARRRAALVRRRGASARAQSRPRDSAGMAHSTSKVCCVPAPGGADDAIRPAPRCGAPAATPATRSWRPWTRRVPRSAVITVAEQAGGSGRTRSSKPPSR